MTVWYEVWGREWGTAEAVPLYEFPAVQFDAADCWRFCEGLRAQGVTEIEVRRVER